MQENANANEGDRHLGSAFLLDFRKVVLIFDYIGNHPLALVIFLEYSTDAASPCHRTRKTRIAVAVLLRIARRVAVTPHAALYIQLFGDDNPGFMLVAVRGQEGSISKNLAAKF